jgi:Rod binding domain-containing protein
VPDSLPPIDRSLLPPEIRNGSAQDRKTYTAALGFERMLVQQLAKAMNATATDGSSDEGADAATTTYKDLLPGALADGIIAGGGLGLARQLTPALNKVTR